MDNCSYTIVSKITNENGTEKTSIIYDKINRRIIEKWVSYQLVRDKNKHIITDRFIYAFNKNGNIKTKIEVLKGNDNRDFSYFSDNNEYCHCINREIKYDGLRYQNNNAKTEIIYTSTDHVGIKKNRRFLKKIVLKIMPKKRIQFQEVRLYSTLDENKKLTKYKYSTHNPTEIASITKYKVLFDLTIINKIFLFSGIPLFQSIPDIFLKKRIWKKKVNAIYKTHKIHYLNTDYFISNSADYAIIDDAIFEEDIFIKEKKSLLKEYEVELGEITN